MYTAKRRELLEICRLVYDRHLTNAAGSNFSARASENTLYISINGNAKRNRLRMTADDLLLSTFDGKILEGEGKFSQSWPTHLKMYQGFDFVGAAIHAHPRFATAFACRNIPMPPFLDAMKKYGEIPVLPRNLKVDSPEFGDAIVEIFPPEGRELSKHGHGVLYPYHGVLVVAPNLDDAYDLFERIEDNATAILSNILLDMGQLRPADQRRKGHPNERLMYPYDLFIAAPNSAIDSYYELASLEIGKVNKALRAFHTAGGKGFNAARALQNLGGLALCAGIVAGNAGQFILAELDREGIAHDLVCGAGESRRCNTVHVARQEDTTVVLENGDQADPQTIRAFAQRILDSLHRRSLYCPGRQPAGRISARLLWRPDPAIEGGRLQSLCRQLRFSFAASG